MYGWAWGSNISYFHDISTLLWFWRMENGGYINVYDSVNNTEKSNILVQAKLPWNYAARRTRTERSIPLQLGLRPEVTRQ